MTDSAVVFSAKDIEESNVVFISLMRVAVKLSDRLGPETLKVLTEAERGLLKVCRAELKEVGL